MGVFEFDQPQTDSRKLTVSELTQEIKLLLETSIPPVWVEGEISNFKHHYSGHMYFSLKDEGAQIPCVMWRSRNANLGFEPQDGMNVLALGQITLYEKRGAYQLDIVQMKPAGIGALQLAFEQMKQRLEAEGLFDPEHKQAIPRFPETIGIVTSSTGAAIRDLISILQRRYPPAEIILRPAKVQGDGAAEDVAAAIEEFNEFGEVDVLIIGRGGGSIEDLWAFNEEIVARAIFNSKIPVISAVGHEIDFCISDFVADLRAPTPSAAAELAVPDATELISHTTMLMVRAQNRIQEKLKSYQEKLKGIVQSYGFRRPVDLLKQYNQRLDEIERSMSRAIQHQLKLKKQELTTLQKGLDSLNPKSILARGYSICYKADSQEIIKDANTLNPNENIDILFHIGKARSEIKYTDSN